MSKKGYSTQQRGVVQHVVLFVIVSVQFVLSVFLVGIYICCVTKTSFVFNMKEIKWFLLVMMIISFSCTKTEKEMDEVIIDKEGVMRFASSNEEASFFGVNYTTPFAHAYRALGYLEKDYKEVIDNDVYHISRLGVNAYRIHIWDVEISDSEGNLKDNHHLDLLDYLIYKLKERGIYTLVTLQTNFGNGYPERNIQTGGFSYDYKKDIIHSDPKALQAQKKYAAAIVSHINRYTGLSYMTDPAIVGFEINNEPTHSVSSQVTHNYISEMVRSIEGAGNKKPLFYNVSHNLDHVDAYFNSNIQGTTYQWYPIGLVAGHIRKGNFLPFVDSYDIPFDQIRGFENKTKIIYEFDPADILYSYMFPATVRTLRGKGFQWITQFAYDPTDIAWANTEYQTHYLNLLYTPSKALGMKIAAEVAYKVKRGETFGGYPNDTVFSDFTVSHHRDLSLVNSSDKFIYTNSTDENPINTESLTEIAGCGTSPLVYYTGTGAYFLDKIENGVWRLEVMPDVMIMEDPFGKASLKRQVAALKSHRNTMRVDLPEFEEGFFIKGINKGNTFKRKVNSTIFEIAPGTYILSVTNKKIKEDATIKNIRINEFYSPQDNAPDCALAHIPAKVAEKENDLNIITDVISQGRIDSVLLYNNRISFWNDENPYLKLDKIDNFRYETNVPAEWLNENKFCYNIVVYSEGKTYTYPEKVKGMPLDWDYIDYKYYETRLENKDSEILVHCPYEMNKGLEYYSIPDWNEKGDKEYYTKKYIRDIIDARPNKSAECKTIKLKGLWQKGDVNVALITSWGYTYEAKARKTAESEYEVRIDELRIAPTLLLPHAYPDFLRKKFIPQENREFEILDSDFIQIHTQEMFNADNLHITFR